MKPTISTLLPLTEKQIADDLYQTADDHLPAASIEDNERKQIVVYSDGVLKVWSENTRDAILQVADKFSRGSGRFQSRRPATAPKRASKQAKFSARVYQTFIEDGEADNAENYSALYGGRTV
jgi:hypothetical protein